MDSVIISKVLVQSIGKPSIKVCTHLFALKLWGTVLARVGAGQYERQMEYVRDRFCETPIELHEPRIFYPSGHWPETVLNAHVSARFR